MAQRTLWITYLRRQNPEVFYVEGAYDEIFKDASLKPRKAKWDSKNKRWEVQREHLNAIKREATQTFDTVMYGEGGDFVEL